MLENSNSDFVEGGSDEGGGDSGGDGSDDGGGDGVGEMLQRMCLVTPGNKVH